MKDRAAFTDEVRPVGRLVPADERGRRALAALRERRLADARRHLESRPAVGPDGVAWKLLLQGWLHLEEGRTVQAETTLVRAVCAATISAHGRVHESCTDDGATVSASADGGSAWRLLAECLHVLGRVYRRQDQPVAAREAHGAALQLCERCGSFEEVWDALISLGLDADLAGEREEAVRHYQRAEEAGGRCAEEPLHKQAVAVSHAAGALSVEGRHAEAVAAARAARELWRRHDVAGVGFARSGLQLGRTLLRWGEALLCASAAEDSGGSAGEWRSPAEIVGEAVSTLGAARDALLAFGPAQHGEAQECAELCDFAGRLAAMSGAGATACDSAGAEPPA